MRVRGAVIVACMTVAVASFLYLMTLNVVQPGNCCDSGTGFWSATFWGAAFAMFGFIGMALLTLVVTADWREWQP